MSFSFETLLCADAMVTGRMQAILRMSHKFGYSSSKCVLWMKDRSSRAVMSSEGKLGKFCFFFISTASSIPSMSVSSQLLNVLQRVSHWLYNSTSSSFLKLSSTPNLALTSPSVSILSSKDSMAVSTTTLKNVVSRLYMSSTIGSPGVS